MLTFALRFAAFAVAFSFVWSPQRAHASPPSAEIFLDAINLEPLGDRYVVGSTLTLTIQFDDAAIASPVVFGASSNIVQVSSTTSELVTPIHASGDLRIVSASVTLRDLGVVDVYVVTPDGATTIARTTIEVVACESVEFAIADDAPWIPIAEVRAMAGGATIAIRCLHDGEPVDEIGAIRIRRVGASADVRLSRARFGPEQFGASGNPFSGTGFGRFVATVSGEERGSVLIGSASPDAIARVTLTASEWNSRFPSITLRARAYDVNQNPIVGAPFDFSVNGADAQTWDDAIALDLDERNPLVPVCVRSVSLTQCVDLNATARVYPVARGYCAVAPPSELLSWWPITLGILFARRIRRALVRA